MGIKPIILCGGSGIRLWPESRKKHPKQFIPLFEGQTLLDLTIERLIQFKNTKKPIIVASNDHYFYINQALERYKIQATVILEPEGKNTTAAIYLAAKASNKDDNLLIMPSDHAIPNKNKFIQLINEIESLNKFNNWITLGIKPQQPSEAYGYIQVVSSNEIFKNVKNFHEKPNKVTAEKLINTGDCYWNSGIFLGNSNMIINSIRKNAPSIANVCDKVFDFKIVSKEGNKITFDKTIFEKIPSKSIDYAVMEYEKNIKLFPFNYEWSDLGSWDAIAEIKNINKNKNKVIQIDSKNNFIRAKSRVIATIGVQDLIIVDSDNAILISKRNHSEKVKQVVSKLNQLNMIEANEHSFEYRPWGKFENLLDNPECKVKRIEVSPNKRLSLQYHKYRSEHWLVVKGTANIYLNGEQLILYENQSIDIPLGSKHYLENKTKEPLIIIETQLGTYFGEDDIIRLDNPNEI